MSADELLQSPGPEQSPGSESAPGAGSRRPRTRADRALLIVLLAVAVVCVLIIADDVASTRMPPAWMKVLVPICLLGGAATALWLWGWSAVRVFSRFPWWAAIPVMVVLTLAELMAGLYMFLGTLSSTAEWERVTDLDGTVYWEEPIFDGAIYYRELPGGWVSGEEAARCDYPDCGPPLLREQRREELGR